MSKHDRFLKEISTGLRRCISLSILQSQEFMYPYTRVRGLNVSG